MKWHRFSNRNLVDLPTKFMSGRVKHSAGRTLVLRASFKVLK